MYLGYLSTVSDNLSSCPSEGDGLKSYQTHAPRTKVDLFPSFGHSGLDTRRRTDHPAQVRGVVRCLTDLLDELVNSSASTDRPVRIDVPELVDFRQH